MTLEVPLSVKMAEWTKLATERPLTMEENREVIRLLRAGRASAAASPTKTKASKAPVDLAGLEDEIDNI
jgi:hypothetical protein